MNKQTGFALLLVLWVLSLLTLIAASFIANIKRETAMIATLKDNASTYALAESGIQLAEFMLLTESNKRWRTDGSIYEIKTKDAVLRIQLLAETGKINLNTADLNVLQQLFSHAPSGIETQLPFARINRAAALLDWRDSDDFTRINGAERAQYQDAQRDGLPSNQNLHSLAELPMILGMDEKTLAWLEPLVTIYGQHTTIDLSLASKDVLKIFLNNPEQVEQYVKLRTANAKQDLPAPLPPVTLTETTQATILDSITVIVEVRQQDTIAVIHTVIKKNTTQQNTPFQILSWQRNKPYHHSLFSPDMNELIVKQYDQPEL